MPVDWEPMVASWSSPSRLLAPIELPSIAVEGRSPFPESLLFAHLLRYSAHLCAACASPALSAHPRITGSPF